MNSVNKSAAKPIFGLWQNGCPVLGDIQLQPNVNFPPIGIGMKRGARKSVRKSKGSRRSSLRRQGSAKRRSASRRRQRGGAGPWTGAYTVGPPLTVGSYAQEIIPTTGCDAAAPSGGFIGVVPRGLPGVGGGRRRRTKGRKQRGGRYTFDLQAGAIGNGPFAAGAQVSSIPCEGGMYNTGPTANLPNPVPMAGGAGPYASTDNASYYAPTAGYGNQTSSWVGSAGAPSLLQIPYEARAMNPACLKTN